MRETRHDNGRTGERLAPLHHTASLAGPRPIAAGEVEARPRLRTRAKEGLRDMTEQSARLMRLERRKPSSWVPLASLILSVLLSLGGAILTVGVWKTRQEARDDAIAANQKATADLITASEARLTRAAEKLEDKADKLEGRLMNKVDAINDKVNAIASTTTQQLAEVRADLRASQTEQQRLWEELRLSNLKLETLERKQLRATPGPN